MKGSKLPEFCLQRHRKNTSPRKAANMKEPGTARLICMPNAASTSAGIAAGLDTGPLHARTHCCWLSQMDGWRSLSCVLDRSVFDSCYSRSALHREQQANPGRQANPGKLPSLTLAPRMLCHCNFTLDLQRGTGFQEHIEALPSTPISLHHLCCTSWKQKNTSELRSGDRKKFHLCNAQL